MCESVSTDFRKELLPTYKPCCDTPQLRLSLRIPVKSKKCATIVRYQMSAHNEQSLVLRQGKQVWAVEQDLGPAIFIVHKSLSGAFDACESQNDVRTDDLAYRVYQRTTAAAEVERSWSSIRSLVYIASTDETNERRQTHQFLKGGITHVTWAVRGLTRINVGTSHWAIQHSR